MDHIPLTRLLPLSVFWYTHIIIIMWAGQHLTGLGEVEREEGLNIAPQSLKTTLYGLVFASLRFSPIISRRCGISISVRQHTPFLIGGGKLVSLARDSLIARLMAFTASNIRLTAFVRYSTPPMVCIFDGPTIFQACRSLLSQPDG